MNPEETLVEPVNGVTPAGSDRTVPVDPAGVD